MHQPNISHNGHTEMPETNADDFAAKNYNHPPNMYFENGSMAKGNSLWAHE